MKRSLLGSLARTLFSRAYLSAYPYGRTFGPSVGQSRAKPEKFVLNDLSVGTYYKFSNAVTYKSTITDFSNYLYLHSVSIQEALETHNLQKQKLTNVPVLATIQQMRHSQMQSKLLKEVNIFQSDLNELVEQISTIAKITFSNQQPSKLPVACATNILYLLALYNDVNLKDVQNLNMTFSFCLKLLEEKLENIHLEGIAQAIWGLARLLERGGQVAQLFTGPNGQRVIDKLVKSLEGRAFGDEIRYVDKVGLNLDQYSAASEYLSNRSDSGINYLSENWAAFILIEGLIELKEKRGFTIDTNLIDSLQAKRGGLSSETLARMRLAQTYLIPKQIQEELGVSQS